MSHHLVKENQFDDEPGHISWKVQVHDYHLQYYQYGMTIDVKANKQL